VLFSYPHVYWVSSRADCSLPMPKCLLYRALGTGKLPTGDWLLHSTEDERT